MSNRYSNFPSAIDELKRLSEVQEMTVTQKRKVNRYTSLATKEVFTPIEEVELQTLIQELKDFQLNSSDWNEVVDAVIKMQEHYINKILPDIGALVDNAEANINVLIDTKTQEITSTTTSAKDEINTLKVSTMSELSQKISDIVAKGQIGVDFFKGRNVANVETSSVLISVPQYNKSSDFLMVHVNGGLVSEGINYTIGTDGYSIKSVGGTWSIGTVFDFIVLKKTVVLLETYDVGLFEDGSFRKEKLTVDLQNEISKVNQVETSLTEFKTSTNVSLDKITQQLDNYNSYASIKDSNGIYTVVEYKRADGTLYMKSTLSGGISPNYTTDTWSFYNDLGTVVVTTKVWTITYDTEGKILSKVVL